MNHIKEYNNFITEALGIAEPTLYYVDICKTKAWDTILITIQDHDYVKVDKKYEAQLVIPFQEFRKHITDWNMFSYFPVSQILIDVTVEKKPVDKVKSSRMGTDIKFEVPFKVSAYASPFARGRERAATRIMEPIRQNTDHSLSLHIGIDLIFSDNLDLDRHSNRLQLEIESTILHELNHLYEYYCRKMKGSKNMDLALTWTAIGDNRYRRKKELYDYWYRNFTYFIYLSEPHEIRAWVQESKSYVDRLDFRSFQRTRMYKTPKYMKDWDYNTFISEFNRLCDRINPEYNDTYIDVLIGDFIRNYSRIASEFKEEQMISSDKLKNMSREQFFEYWQKILNNAGDLMLRRMGRLYALKSSEEEKYEDF